MVRIFRKTLTNFENDMGPENHNKLKLVNGVIVPCMLHMMGILFFLKIGWSVGMTGWFPTLMYIFIYNGFTYRMFIVGESMALFTAMSLSALCTNGKMRAGGAYYMISRSLGPEFGGAMAALFFTAYVIGSTFHITGMFIFYYIYCLRIGVVELITNSFFADSAEKWHIPIGTIILICVTLVAMIGAESYGKINRFLWAGQLICIWLTFGFMVFSPANKVPFDVDFLMYSLWPTVVCTQVCLGVLLRRTSLLRITTFFYLFFNVVVLCLPLLFVKSSARSSLL